MSEVRKCCVEVYPKERAGWLYKHPCGNKAKIERDGKPYCLIHDPVSKKAKDDAKFKKWREESEAKRAAYEAPAKRIAELEAELSKVQSLNADYLYLIKCGNDEIKKLESELSSLRLKLEECQKDADRYKFLRRFDHFAQVDAMLDTIKYNTLDSAVDEAIRLAEKEEK